MLGKSSQFDFNLSTEDREVYVDRLLNTILVLLVLLGVFLLLSDLDAKRLDGDELNSMVLVNQPFRTYLSDFHYGYLIKIQFWISNRLFEDSLAGYRLFGALAASLNLILIAVFGRKLWPHSSVALLLVLFYTVFNVNVLEFGRWGMSNYGEYILASSLLFLAFLKCLNGPLEGFSRILFILLIVVVPWIYLTLLFPCVLFFVLILTKRMGDGGWNMSALVNGLKELSYFAYFAIALLQQLFVISHDNWVRARDHHFNISEWQAFNPEGSVWHYLTNQTHELFVSLFSTSTGFQVASANIDDQITFIAIACAVGGGLTAIARVIKRREADTSWFVFLYFFLLLVGLAILGVLGHFPYGGSRYAMFLLLPGLFLAGYFVSTVGQFLVRFIKVDLDYLVLPIVTGLTLSTFVLAVDRAGAFSEARELEKSEWDSLLRTFYQKGPQAVLFPNLGYFWPSHLLPHGTVYSTRIYGRFGDEWDWSDEIAMNLSGMTRITLLGQGSGWSDFQQMFPSYRNVVESSSWQLESCYRFPPYFTESYVRKPRGQKAKLQVPEVGDCPPMKTSPVLPSNTVFDLER
jgi:hypothetical protein